MATFLRRMLLQSTLLFLTPALWAEDVIRYGLGKLASQQEITEWNTDVRADGSGLPIGSGNAIQGKPVYQSLCQHCHGIDGKGGVNDQLVSSKPDHPVLFVQPNAPKKTIGNYWPWATTVFDYIKRTMPYTSPGSLTDDQVYAVTAYLLFENNIISEGFELNASSLPTIKMPANGYFVPDTRLQTNQVR